MGPSAPAGTRSNRDKNIRTCSSAPQHGTPPAHQRRVNSPFEQFRHSPALLLKPNFARSGLSHQRIDHPLHTQAPPAWPYLLHPRVLYSASLSVFGLVSNDAPFSVAHLGFATPSRVKGQEVVSIASCAPRNKGKPSTTTSSLLSSRLLITSNSRSRTDHIHSDPSACFLADSCCHVLQWKSTTTQHPSNWTRRPMMAKAVKETATSARAYSDGGEADGDDARRAT